MDDKAAQALLWKLVEEVGTCMMVTHGDALIHARPMRGKAAPEDNAIWFLTDRGSPKEAEIATHRYGCLTYADPSKNSYVALSGNLSILWDADKIREMWGEAAAAYFEQGPDDPKLALMRFTPESGEYWDSPSNPIILAIKFVESKITGKRPELGTNQKVQLN